MKRIILVLLAITSIAFLMTGCSGKETEKPESSGTESTQGTSSVESDAKYAPLIPKPEDIFTDGVITIIDKDGGKAYAFRVTNYKDGEYDSYVAKCKEMGFSNIHDESETSGGKTFMAYTEDKSYYLEVFLGNQINAIDVSCKEVTEK